MDEADSESRLSDTSIDPIFGEDDSVVQSWATKTFHGLDNAAVDAFVTEDEEVVLSQVVCAPWQHTPAFSFDFSDMDDLFLDVDGFDLDFGAAWDEARTGTRQRFFLARSTLLCPPRVGRPFIRYEYALIHSSSSTLRYVTLPGLLALDTRFVRKRACKCKRRNPGLVTFLSRGTIAGMALPKKTTVSSYFFSNS